MVLILGLYSVPLIYVYPSANTIQSFFFLIFIYLAASGLLAQLCHVGSFVAGRGLFVAARGLLSSCGVWAL